MARQATIWSPIGPIQVDETGTRQASVGGAQLNETVSASNNITGTVETAQGNQSVDSNALLIFTGTETSAQGQTVDATGSVSAAGISGTGSTAQGSQSAESTGKLEFTGTNTANQGNQSVNSAANQAFLGSVSSSNAQTVISIGVLEFKGSSTSANGSQSVSAEGFVGRDVEGTAETGQGQEVNALGTVTGGSELLDGAGVGVGNRSWWNDKELVIDHRIRHTGELASAQAKQSTLAEGSVINPVLPTSILNLIGQQASQATLATGDVTDPELEMFAAVAAMMFDELEEA